MRPFGNIVARPVRRTFNDASNEQFSDRFTTDDRFIEAFSGERNDSLLGGYRDIGPAYQDAFYSRWGGFNSESGVPSGFFAAWLW